MIWHSFQRMNTHIILRLAKIGRKKGHRGLVGSLKEGSSPNVPVPSVPARNAVDNRLIHLQAFVNSFYMLYVYVCLHFYRHRWRYIRKPANSCQMFEKNDHNWQTWRSKSKPSEVSRTSKRTRAGAGGDNPRGEARGDHRSRPTGDRPRAPPRTRSEPCGVATLGSPHLRW